MKKRGFLFILFFIVLAPSAFAITLQDLINFFNFNFFTTKINVTNYNDFMVDKDQNNINDSLYIELATDGSAGTYLVVIDLYDENVIKNETNKTLNAGTNKFNITFSTDFFTKNKFNYTIKIYEENYSLKYSRENIETQFYNNYETAINIITISDKSMNNNYLQLNLTINFTKNNIYEIISYLKYNDSIIFKKINQTIISGVNNILINFSNKTIKNTHYIGKFNLSNIKINNKIIRTDYLTNLYDYKDFTQSSYFINFSDYGSDINNNELFDYLKLNSCIEIKNNGTYKVDLAIYDLFDNFIEQINKTEIFSVGIRNIIIDINGTKIYDKKLNGPFIVRYAKLIKNNNIVDHVNDFYTTQNYNYTNFEKPNLPDLSVSIDASEDYFENNATYNITFNVTVNNIGNKAAYNVFIEIFDNYTYSRNEYSNILPTGSSVKYTVDFVNISDMEFNAIVDFDDFVEESNESNNILKKIIIISDLEEKCKNKWQCTQWSECTDNVKTRTCTDLNNCGSFVNKPKESRKCKCKSKWQCTPWSECINDAKTRTCIDINNCENFSHKPKESMKCQIKAKKSEVKTELKTPPYQEINEIPVSKEKIKSEEVLQDITGYLLNPPENTNKGIGTLIVSVIIITGLFGYFYFLHKPY